MGFSFLALNYYINSANGANSFSSTNLNSSYNYYISFLPIKYIKCLKQVLRWYSNSNAIIC